MKKKFIPDCTVLCMIQPEPLPGSYLHDRLTIDEIVEKAMAETDMVVKNGFDGIIIQNMNDMPVKQIANPEVIAYMTRIGLEIRKKYPELIVGILVNWDGVAALSVADAIGADFVRVEHLYTGAEVTSAGILEAQCVDICALRKRTRTQIPVYADVYEVHGVPLGAKPIEDAAWEAAHEGFADGLFVSGKTTQQSLEMISAIRKKLPTTPILLGGGATGENIRELLNQYDGVSVATWIKDGNMKNPINPQKSEFFMSEANKAKKDRNIAE